MTKPAGATRSAWFGHPSSRRPAMAAESTLPDEIAGRFRSALVLKRDVFSTIERGHFLTERGEVPAVLRRIDVAPWWTFPVALHLFRREARALTVAGKLGIAPPLLFAGRRSLVRGWIDGLPVHIAKPVADLAYFRSAKRSLRALHRAGLTHNDTAKAQNWLRTPDGRAALTDFQLASRFRRRSLLFRLMAYEDLRHLLKHKRRYAPQSLTARERRVLARKSVLTRLWMATGKRVYLWITRGVLKVADREGGGLRLVADAPALTAWLKRHPSVRDAAIVPFPDRSGAGLYAFVESDAPDASLLRELAATAVPARMPERLQVVARLPRDGLGAPHTGILQLIAMNQIDLIDLLIASDAEKEVVARIVAGRRNLRDRYAS